MFQLCQFLFAMTYIKDQHCSVSLEEEQSEALKLSPSELLRVPCALQICLMRFHTSSMLSSPNKESCKQFAATAKLLSTNRTLCRWALWFLIDSITAVRTPNRGFFVGSFTFQHMHFAVCTPHARIWLFLLYCLCIQWEKTWNQRSQLLVLLVPRSWHTATGRRLFPYKTREAASPQSTPKHTALRKRQSFTILRSTGRFIYLFQLKSHHFRVHQQILQWSPSSNTLL